MCENHTEKCLCTYCSGTIAKGMKTINEKNVLQCNELIDSYNNNNIQNNFQELSSILDYLNPVQCFDILDKLSSKYSNIIKYDELDELILKYIIRYRNNGGFFLALKEPQNQRQHLLHRLINVILIKQENAQKTNLTPAEIH